MKHTPFISSTTSPRKSTTPSLSITMSLSTDALQPHSRNTQLIRSAHAASGVALYESRKSCTVDSSAVAGFKSASGQKERIVNIWYADCEGSCRLTEQCVVVRDGRVLHRGDGIECGVLTPSSCLADPWSLPCSSIRCRRCDSYLCGNLLGRARARIRVLGFIPITGPFGPIIGRPPILAIVNIFVALIATRFRAFALLTRNYMA